MSERLRLVGFVTFVIIAAAGIYLAFYANKEVKQDVLAYSLNLLGDKLLTMVPDGPQKTKLAQAYEEFKQRAIARKVAPEQVEQVAANILNATTSEKNLTSEQAEALLHSGLMFPPKMQPPHSSQTPLQKPPSGKEPPSSEKWIALTENLKTVLEFNENFQKVIREKAEKQKKMAMQFHYRVDNGLKLALDPELRQYLDEHEMQQLTKEMQQLEKANLLEWQTNLQEELQKEMQQLDEELATLQKSMAELKQQKMLESVQKLEIMKGLEGLENIPFINADSIYNAVGESLRAAGIYQDKK